MNYLLDIKNGLPIESDNRTIASNQQSAISNQQSAISNQQSAISTRFFLIFILLHYILLCFFPLLRGLFHLVALLKSYGVRFCLHSLVIPIDCR
ncbi:TPA: hypothetical protein I8036_003031 [Legionella pneumophila]|nr:MULTISPECIES: hypothetical protein [Legionella]HAT2134464.1 hypothetical protein [Legionella pneumophila]MCW8400493.1 hypothetical protein [Legionella sp. PATHC038]HDV5714189.1 hypothetical protein [Legionella pneumophila]HEO1456203.1 hypothetical protein [Legionella pneumophila]HEO1459354.1 hypothetical protein [Legionella pneumophila]